MIKDVIVNIKGIQGIDDDTDIIEFTTDGRFGEKNGEFFISYDEGQMLEDDTRVKTSIFIKPDSVVLQRSGTVSCRMVIEKGVRNTCFYSTPHGSLVLGIYGEAIQYNLSQNGGSLEMSYNIDSDARLISQNSVNISIREVN